MEMIGIDVGGTGIKAAIVETASGELTTPRVRVPTPQPATPKAVVKATAGLVADLPRRPARRRRLPRGGPARSREDRRQHRRSLDRHPGRRTLRRRIGAVAHHRQRRRCGRSRRDALRRRPRAGGYRAHAHARYGHRVGAVPRRRAGPEHRVRASSGARQGCRAARSRVDQGQQGTELARLEQAPGRVRRCHRCAALARSRDHRRGRQQGGGQVHRRAAVAREVRSRAAAEPGRHRGRGHARGRGNGADRTSGLQGDA